jgi:hypothetical protein
MEDNTFLNADNIYQDVEGEAGKTLSLELDQQRNLIGIIKGRFTQAENSRDIAEKRWIRAYENYRGLYAKNVKFRESEKSRVFVKITKTKVLAAFGQLVDVIFGTGKFPIGVSETKMPEGETDIAHLDINNPTPGIETTEGEIPDDIGNRIDNPYDVGYEGDGQTLKPGASFYNGIFKDSLEDQAKDIGILTNGASANPKAIELNPAQRAARRMEKLIHDQIDESSGSSEIRNALLESALLGTGIVKGPFNFNKKLHKWDVTEDGEREYNPLEVRVPRIEFVSCWDFYPDPSGTTMDECEYVIHRHKMNRSQLRQLRHMPYFDEDAIREAIQMGANYVEKDYEYAIKDDNRAEDNLMMFDKFRQLADEQTGIPSYSHGQTGVQSMTRTASGMSMLLGASSLNIKTVVKNLDDFLLKPLGESYFQWNMQFLEDELDVKGDLEVKATGTNSLMQKEVRSQRLTMFLQTAQSPAIAPFVKISKLVSELAYSLDLDPEEILNDPEEAAIMAQIIGMQNVGQNNGEETQPDSQQSPMAGLQGTPQQPQELGDTGTGGGNIGTGNVPVAGETSFAGTPRAVAGAGEGGT